MTDALKPCPFCGGQTKAYFAERIFYTTKEELWSCECVNYNARCMIGPSSEQMPYEDMVAVWNTRPAENALAAERDALREELRQQVDAAEAERGRLAAWQARVWDALRADLDALDDDADEPIEDAFRRWFPRLNAALGEGGGDG